MVKIFTAGHYMIKGNKQVAIEDRLYKREELIGWSSPSHRVQLKDMDTGIMGKAIFPGQPFVNDNTPVDNTPVDNTPVDNPVGTPGVVYSKAQLKKMTKKEIKALMPGKMFPNKTTKKLLIEAYNG